MGLIEIIRPRLLHDAPGVHQLNCVGNRRHDTKVVSYQYEPHVVLLLKAPKKLHDLGLNRHIESRSRLIGNQDSRVE